MTEITSNKPILITGNDDGIRCERYIERKYPQVPRGMRHKFFRTKKIAVFRAGKRLKIEKSLTLKKGDEVKIFFQPSDFGVRKITKKSINFDAVLKNPKLKKTKILYEDEYCFVVDKPAGVAVHPGSGIMHGHSLIDYCVALVRNKNPEAPEPKLVHRLDKDTSGLVMVAKNDGFLRKIIDLLQKGGIQKIYKTLVKGELSKDSGTIREKIARREERAKGGGSKYTKISINSEKGKDSVTHYTVEKYFPKLDASLIEVLLETGRMHQIRIHFASNNHPLAGDQIYGDFRWNRELQTYYKLKRQALHAYSLQFKHPETGEKVYVQSEVPEEITKIYT
jgi:RluA family pseudouridine synthase